MQERGARPAVRLSGVTAGYGGKPVLRDLALRVGPREFVGVVGPSGSGKTTLLRALTGQARCFAGSAEVFGAPPGRARVGYVPQLDAIDWDFPVTVLQTVLLGAAADSAHRPWFSRAEHARALGILDQLGLASLARRQIRELSGGQQRRVFVARALMRGADLLLLDEPTSGVDLGTRRDLLRLLGDLNAEGVTILLTTHDLNWVAAHLPRVVFLNGTVLADGPPAEAITEDVLLRAYGAPMRVLRDGETVVVVDEEALLPPPPHEPSAVERAT